LCPLISSTTASTSVWLAPGTIHGPTFRIWEGIIPYLNRAAFLSTLAAVAARSAPGSKLAATYGDTTVSASRLARWLMALFGEPFRSVSTPEEIARDMGREGMRVVSDTNGLEWAKRWSTTPGGRKAQFLRERHLVVAERIDS